MGHRPAPVQVSYIGFPVSTGAKYIDYYLADHVALPAEDRTQFVEKLALIPTTSIVNDYAQIRGGLLDYNYDNRQPRDDLMVCVCVYVCMYVCMLASRS
jgi:predicted O-linked N-acetylglucosamine transferase (SPINDLY family)